MLATPADDAAATLALLAEAVGAAEMELPRERVAQFAPPGAQLHIYSNTFTYLYVYVCIYTHIMLQSFCGLHRQAT